MNYDVNDFLGAYPTGFSVPIFSLKFPNFDDSRFSGCAIAGDFSSSKARGTRGFSRNSRARHHPHLPLSDGFHLSHRTHFTDSCSSHLAEFDEVFYFEIC